MSSRTQRGRGEAERRDHYAEVTERMIAALESGVPPWRRPWDPDKAGGPAMPRNAVTGARYRGINTIVLGMSPLAYDSADPRWATYKQAADRGWQVRKGERGTTAYFFKRLEVRDDTADPGEGAEEPTRRIPCCAPSRCSTQARSKARRRLCRRRSPRRHGGRRTRSRPSSPTAAPSCAWAATAPSTRRRPTTSRCRRRPHSTPCPAGAAPSCMRPRTGRARRRG